MHLLTKSCLALACCLAAAGVRAEAVRLDALLTTSESISLGFKNDDRRFVTLLKRDGIASGSGAFDGAKVTEYGMHDVTNGDAAEATGYLEVTAPSGDTAYFRWLLQAEFVIGPDGTAKVINGGTWVLTGGTGQFSGQRGVGTMRIEFPSKTERRYILEGDISPEP